ncbi:MAG: PAS domain S-box protein, partial [Calditrichia bacterium]
MKKLLANRYNSYSHFITRDEISGLPALVQNLLSLPLAASQTKCSLPFLAEACDQVQSFSPLLDSLDDVFLHTDSGGIITQVSAGIKRMFEYSNQEAIGKSWVELFRPEPQKFTLLQAELEEKGFIANYELNLQRKDGTVLPVMAAFRLSKTPEGKTTGQEGILRNIGELQAVRNDLAKTKYFFKERLKELNCLYSVSRILNDPRISAEEVFQQILEIICRSWQYPEVTVCRIRSGYGEYCSNNFMESPWHMSGSLESNGLRFGEVEVFYLDSRPVQDEGPFLKEERYLLDTLGRNIGDYLLREKTRRENQYYSSLIHSSNDAIISKDLNGIITSWNRAAERIYGYTREEALGRSIALIFPPEKTGEIPQLIYRVTSGENLESLETLRRRKDGTKITVQISLSAIRHHSEVIGISIIARDVTEYKKLFNNLEDSKQKLQTLVENSPVLFFGINTEGIYTYCSGGALKHFPYRGDEFVGKNVFDLHGDVPSGLESVREALKGKEVTWKGTVFGRIFQSHLQPQRNSQGSLTGLIGVAVDITEKELAQNSLKTKQEQFKAIFDNVMNGILLADDEAKYVDVNPAACQMLGYTREEILQLSIADLTPPPDRDKLQSLWTEYLETGRQLGSFRMLKKNGEYLHTEFQAVANILPGIHLSVIEDITDRLKYQEELADSESRFRLMTESSLAGVYILKDDVFIYVNPAFAQAFGYTREEINNHLTTRELIHPDDQPLYKLHKQKRLQGEVEYSRFRLRGIRKDGTILFMEALGRVVTYKGQQIIIGTILDISETRKAEEAMLYRLSMEQIISEISSRFISLRNKKEFRKVLLEGFDRIGKLGDFDRIYIFEYSPDYKMMSNILEWCAAGIPAQQDDLQNLSTANYPWWTAQLRSRKIIRINSVASLGEAQKAEKKILQKQKIQSLLVVPLYLGDNLIGFMGFDAVTKNKTWSNEEVSLLRLMSEVYLNAYENVRTAEALRLSEHTYRSLYESMAEGIVYHDETGDIISANPAALEILGIEQSEFQNRAYWQAFNQDGSELPIEQHPFTLAINSGRVVKNRILRIYNKRRQRHVWINISAIPQFIEGQDRPYQVFTTFSDITERKLALDGLQRRDAILEAVSFAGERFLNAGDWDENLPFILKQLGEASGVSRVYIFKNSVAENGDLVCSQVHEWCAPGIPRQIDNPDLQNVPYDLTGFKRWRLSFQKGELIAGHVCNLPDNEKKILQPQGICSLVLTPIFSGNIWWGFMGFDKCDSEWEWNDAEIKALQTAANIIGAAQQKKAVEEDLYNTTEMYKNLMKTSPDAIAITDMAGNFIEVSERIVEQQWVDSHAEALQQNIFSFMTPDSRVKFSRFLQKTLQNGIQPPEEYEFLQKNGAVFTGEINAAVLKDAQNNPKGFVTTIRDITDRKKLEQQLNQAQKMEAVGRLAGGVAHDFNNLLTVINGYSSLLINSLNNNDDAIKKIEMIHSAGQRASGLTSQLLAFSRKQIIIPQALQINDIIRNMTKMLARLIGEDVELKTRLAPGLKPVKMDPGQVDQIMMNMAVNARDAMPTGGRLIIETRTVNLDDAFVSAHVGSRKGPHVEISLSDSGSGISRENLKLIFEPFFTTKPKGQGTGLGLSTVYGIVKQNGGYITVYSEVGIGTTFKIYLPVLQDGS